MSTETTAMERPGAKRTGVRREVSTTAVWIALLALLVLVLGACSESDSTAGDDSTTSQASAATSTVPDGPEPTSAPVPEEPECSAEALWAAAPRSDLPEGANITEFACTPASAGDLYGGYAWALVEAPEADGADILYTAYVGQGDEGPDFGEWEVLTWGTDVACDQTEIPVEACDMLGW